MRPFRDLPIRHKLTAVIMLTSSFALLIASLWSSLAEYRLARNAIVMNVTSMADIIGMNSAAALTFDDRKSATNTLEALRARPHIVFAGIYTGTGELFSGFSGPKTDGVSRSQHALKDEFRNVYAPTTGEEGLWQRYLDFYSPILLDGEKIGTIFIRYDLQGIHSLFLANMGIFGGVMAATLLLTYLLASRLQSLISKPVLSLAQVMKRVSRERDYSLRVEKRGDDELGTLVDGFNEMLFQIEERDQKINRHREQLEEEVAVRTEELSRTNCDLEGAVNELKKAKDAAETASRTKSQFLANMSHEIRTPMNGILGMTDLLLQSGLTDKQAHFAETVKNSAGALLAILNDILDFSKIEAGKMDIMDIPFDLHKTVESTVEMLADHAQRKGLELTCRIDADMSASFQGDPARLRQIYTNLIGNAIKFTEQGEVNVFVTVAPDSEETVILRSEIRDTGIGLRPEERARIFDPFSQADGSAARKYTGTGLGLSISRQLIQMMGGEIGVISEFEKGSTFWFTVRLNKQHAQTVAPGFHQVLKEGKVLIVDDNETNRSVLGHYVVSLGMRSRGCGSVSGALEELRAAAAEKAPYDFVILDANMPGTAGLGVDPAFVSVRIILMTSVGLHDAFEGPIPDLVFCSLTKPVKKSELYDALSGHPEGSGRQGPDEIRYSQKNRKKFEARVLLVEDNEVNQQVERLALEGLGCRVDVAYNGKKAIDALVEKPYDLIFMDCQMPGMDGYEATRIIREKEKIKNAGLEETDAGYEHATIIALTAHAMQGAREQCLAAGMDDYLSKPFRMKELSEIIDRWLSNTRVPGQLPENRNKRHFLEQASPSPLDQESLDNIRLLQRDGSDNIIGRLIGIYLRDTPSALQRLEEAFAAGDTRTLYETAHNLKSTSAILGAIKLSGFFSEIEVKGRMGSAEGVDKVLAMLRDEFALVCTALRAEIEKEVS